MEECTCLRELLSESGAIGLLLYKLLIVPGKVLQRFVPFSVVPDSMISITFFLDLFDGAPLDAAQCSGVFPSTSIRPTVAPCLSRSFTYSW